ncbi:alpha/beta hydrolase [Pokkaliibacter sp. CJK22405]|uniref:alpha/beta hydrolase n=1 Tax=Pokkaliibacter sp. CJK22405 TaxID=3384615 RepID=UPI003984DCEE
MKLVAGCLALLAVIGGLAACSPVKVVNALTPEDSYTLSQDVPYGTESRQTMDIYTPVKQKHSAVIVFVHGGSWASGDKSQYPFVGEAFASLGFVTVIPNYRLYPEGQFPTFETDIASAVASLPDALKNNTCATPGRIILVGHSAGAHTVGMLVTNTAYLDDAGFSGEVLGWIGMAGPYDLPLEDPLVVDKFQHVQGNEANPLALAHADMPPALLLHGLDDSTVGPFHSQRMAKKLKELGDSVVLKEYKGTNHTRLVGGLAYPLRFLNDAFVDSKAFVDSLDATISCP